MRGNRTDLGSRVRAFFERHPEGSYSANEVAGALGVSPNTIGQYLLTLTEGGELTRRMHGVARGRHYVYTKAPDVSIDLDPRPPRPDVRDMRVIGWEQLPEWLRTAEVVEAERCTWLTAHDVYYCFGPDGNYKMAFTARQGAQK